MEKIKNLADAKAALDRKIEEGNKAIANKQPITTDFQAECVALEKEYKDYAEREVFEQLAKEKMPVIAAIKRLTYSVKQIGETKDKDGKINGFELVEKQRQIDLLKFCKYAKLDDSWQYEVATFNQSLCLRVADELGYTASELKKLAGTYYLAKEAQKLLDGKTVTSNTALTKKLQRVIDSILPPADETKGNAYKCNNHDLMFILMGYTKLGRNGLSIAVAKDGYLRNVVMRALHCIVTGGMYSVDYKTIKDAKMVRGAVETKEVQTSEEFDEDAPAA